MWLVRPTFLKIWPIHEITNSKTKLKNNSKTLFESIQNIISNFWRPKLANIYEEDWLLFYSWKMLFWFGDEKSWPLTQLSQLLSSVLLAPRLSKKRLRNHNKSNRFASKKLSPSKCDWFVALSGKKHYFGNQNHEY